MNSISNFIVEADGGSRGNPGPAGSGAVIINADTGRIIYEVARFIGIATNNVAEYTALLAALQIIDGLSARANVSVRMDSKLVIEQMAGRWKIKHPDMQILGAEVQKIVARHSVSWQWIPRELNSQADALANRAMDASSDCDADFLRGQESIAGSADSENLISNQAQAAKPMAAVGEFNTSRPSSVRAPGNVREELTTVILVRHGRTILTESKRMSGRGGANPGLSEAGFEDARKVALEVSKIGKSGQWAHLPTPDAVVSSPIQRTLDTANTIAQTLGLQTEVFEEFAEISFGEWDGLTHDEAQQMWPEEWANWQGSWTVAPPNGESLEAFEARVFKGIDRLTNEYAGKTVVVSAHVMPIRAFIKRAIGGSIETYWRPQIAPCSVSIIRLWGSEAAEILAINSTSHLV
jgi:probable phosphoglycerate mutase